jgi:hypothetical protein
MWRAISCNKAKKENHALHGQQLYLFKYAVAVYRREHAAQQEAKRIKA